MLRAAVLDLAKSFSLAVEIVVETCNVRIHIQGWLSCIELSPGLRREGDTAT